MWKVLVYDNIGQSILAPIFSVKELRELGVTLHIGKSIFYFKFSPLDGVHLSQLHFYFPTHGVPSIKGTNKVRKVNKTKFCGNAPPGDHFMH